MDQPACREAWGLVDAVSMVYLSKNSALVRNEGAIWEEIRYACIKDVVSHEQEWCCGDYSILQNELKAGKDDVDPCALPAQLAHRAKTFA